MINLGVFRLSSGSVIRWFWGFRVRVVRKEILEFFVIRVFKMWMLWVLKIILGCILVVWEIWWKVWVWMYLLVRVMKGFFLRFWKEMLVVWVVKGWLGVMIIWMGVCVIICVEKEFCCRGVKDFRRVMLMMLWVSIFVSFWDLWFLIFKCCNNFVVSRVGV